MIKRYGKVALISLGVLAGGSLYAQENAPSDGLFELFNEQIPAGSEWSQEFTHGSKIRGGGLVGGTTSTNYLYMRTGDCPASVTGLSVPIRRNPGPGEFRYLSLTWVKWHGGLIGLQFDSVAEDGREKSFLYYAGEGDIEADQAIQVKKEVSGGWLRETRDLAKDFGDFTITGVTFIMSKNHDGGFDNLFLAQSLSDFDHAPPVLPTGYDVLSPEEVDEGLNYDEAQVSDTSVVEDEIKIDWAQQIKDGGGMMYPLYLLGLVAIVITVQRLMTVREKNLAPRKLRKTLRMLLADGQMELAVKACKRYPSTLAESIKFILLHRHAGMDVVSQSAGDIAARDIRGHLSRIYPLSVISSLSPLLGLLGTIIGMIGAFAKVALYGDEGGAAVLSEDISKALITTAAGLIIAAPSIAIYFIIKNKIMNQASIIEVEIENTITELFLKKGALESAATDEKE